MNDQFGKIIGDALRETRLTDAEKVRMRNVIEAHMDTPYVSKHSRNAVPTPFFFQAVHFRTVSVFMLMFVVGLGGGISYAATGSLPGEPLYPVKVNINEQIEAALVTSPEQKALLAVEFANRRLEEAGKLASIGKLSPDIEKSVTDRFETEANKVNEHLALLETNDETATVEVSDQFEAVLSAHEAVLGRLALKQTEKSQSQDVNRVAEKVRDQVAKLAERHLAYADSIAVAGDASTQIRIMSTAPAENAAPKAATMAMSIDTNASASATVTPPSNAKVASNTMATTSDATTQRFLDKANATLTQAKALLQNTSLTENASRNAGLEILAIEQLVSRAKDAKDTDTARRLSREAFSRSTKFIVLIKAESYSGGNFSDDIPEVEKQKGTESTKTNPGALSTTTPNAAAAGSVEIDFPIQLP